MRDFYDTGKVKIGLMYDKPPQNIPMSSDMERLQRGLLNRKRTIKTEYGVYIFYAVFALFLSFFWVFR